MPCALCNIEMHLFRRTQEKLEVREHKTVERSAPPPSAKVAPTAPKLGLRPAPVSAYSGRKSSFALRMCYPRRGQMLSTEGEGGAQNPSHPVVAEGSTIVT